KKLTPASEEVRTALGDSIKTNGTHTLHMGTNKVQVVAFSGRAATVETTVIPNADKSGLLYKVVIPMITSPVLGFILGFIIMAVLYVFLRSWRPLTVARVFGKAQLASSAYMGFSHGMNDATKCMGIITLALVAATTSGGFAHLPSWAHFLVTPEGSSPFALTLGDRMVAV